MHELEPRIICFFCKWCTSAGESNKLVNNMKPTCPERNSVHPIK